MKYRILQILLLFVLLTSCTNNNAYQKISTALPSEVPETQSIPTLGFTQTNSATIAPLHNGSSPKQIIIDTDMAVDDWFAILYILQRPDAQVLAITVAGTGEAHCNPGVQNAVGLVALAGNAPIPVDCGAEKPLSGNNVFPDDWRTSVDSMLGIPLPQGSNPNVAGGAVELMISMLENSAEPVDLLTLGPLTNVADLLSSRPDLGAKIHKIVIMGGAVNVPGNLNGYVPGNTTAEWNIYIDPAAANIVFDSGIPVILVGLDATNQAQLDEAFYHRFSESTESLEAQFVIQVLDNMQLFIQSGSWYFWDPMAAAILMDESMAKYGNLSLNVVEEAGNTQGAILSATDGPKIQVAIQASRALFIDEFINTINNQ